MLKFRLKWITFILSGMILHISFLYFLIWISLPFSLKSFLILLGVLFIWSVLSALLFNINSSTNILWSPFGIFKKRKIIYHNKLGHFLIFITPREIDVIEIRWFLIKEIITIKNTGKLKEMIKEMKEKLDDVYKNRLDYLQHMESDKKNIKVIKDWDGLLIDTDERRDNKIDNILKK